jgi:hypothetical protein
MLPRLPHGECNDIVVEAGDVSVRAAEGVSGAREAAGGRLPERERLDVECAACGAAAICPSALEVFTGSPYLPSAR